MVKSLVLAGSFALIVTGPASAKPSPPCFSFGSLHTCGGPNFNSLGGTHGFQLILPHVGGDSNENDNLVLDLQGGDLNDDKFENKDKDKDKDKDKNKDKDKDKDKDQDKDKDWDHGPTDCVHGEGKLTDCGEQVDQESTVPEPATMALLATGLVGLGGASILRRRRNARD